MGCGCRKAAQRRSQAIRVSTPRQPVNNANAIRANNVRAMQSSPLKAQATTADANGLNQGGMSAEKRRVQAIRRNEILKKLGKR
jgi:hypothetical protein